MRISFSLAAFAATVFATPLAPANDPSQSASALMQIDAHSLASVGGDPFSDAGPDHLQMGQTESVDTDRLDVLYNTVVQLKKTINKGDPIDTESRQDIIFFMDRQIERIMKGTLFADNHFVESTLDEVQERFHNQKNPKTYEEVLKDFVWVLEEAEKALLQPDKVSFDSKKGELEIKKHLSRLHYLFSDYSRLEMLEDGIKQYWNEKGAVRAEHKKQDRKRNKLTIEEVSLLNKKKRPDGIIDPYTGGVLSDDVLEGVFDNWVGHRR